MKSLMFTGSSGQELRIVDLLYHFKVKSTKTGRGVNRHSLLLPAGTKVEADNGEPLGPSAAAVYRCNSQAELPPSSSSQQDSHCGFHSIRVHSVLCHSSTVIEMLPSCTGLKVKSCK